MNSEFIYVAIGLLTLICNVVLIIILLKNSRARKVEFRSDQKSSKLLLPNMENDRGRKSNGEMNRNKANEEVAMTEIL